MQFLQKYEKLAKISKNGQKWANLCRNGQIYVEMGKFVQKWATYAKICQN